MFSFSYGNSASRIPSSPAARESFQFSVSFRSKNITTPKRHKNKSSPFIHLTQHIEETHLDVKHFCFVGPDCASLARYFGSVSTSLLIFKNCKFMQHQVSVLYASEKALCAVFATYIYTTALHFKCLLLHNEVQITMFHSIVMQHLAQFVALLFSSNFLFDRFLRLFCLKIVI